VEPRILLCYDDAFTTVSKQGSFRLDDTRTSHRSNMYPSLDDQNLGSPNAEDMLAAAVGSYTIALSMGVLKLWIRGC
jgi:hypothetical protein